MTSTATESETLRYDAVLVTGFGGPEAMDQVPDFLNRVTGGHLPPARLAEVSRHYEHFNGVSPVNAQNRELAAELEQRLADKGVQLPVAVAHRFAEPSFSQVLGELAEQGHRAILSLAPAPFGSYISCRSYREMLADALPRDDHGRARLSVAKLAPFADLPALAQAQAELLAPLVANDPQATVVFTTHSIPTQMAETSVHGNGYIGHHQMVINAVLAKMADQGLEPAWRLAYQSRSGAPHTPWLEPDIADELKQLADHGVTSVICSPIGFLSDHMEVIWDLDQQAAEVARELGVGFTRVPTVGTSPVFLDGLTDLVIRAITSGGPGTLCDSDCCPNPAGPHPAVEGVTP